MKLSPMRVEDLDAVVEIERCSFAKPWTPGLFLHERTVPFSRTILARADDRSGRVMGYVCWWLVGDEVHILNIAVHPECRKCGVGRALVELVLRDAEERHASIITLEVRRENTAALALYRSLGFAELGVRQHYYGRGEDAIIMGWTPAQTVRSSAVA
ncbi:MAG: ribosomal protein S18-alanine N-acetyltransferase [Candidatus Binatia bacterium]